MSMNRNTSKNAPDYDELVEGDALWDMLGKAPQTAASPTFVQNTVRAARLSQAESTPLWKKLMIPAIAAPALAVVVIGLFLSQPNSESPSSLAQQDHAESADWLDNALLASAAERPELFSDEELVSLVF